MLVLEDLTVGGEESGTRPKQNGAAEHPIRGRSEESNMWKQAKEPGLSLAELLVVLAITVVLAAILLPAINTPNHAQEKDDGSLVPYAVAAEREMYIEPGVQPEARARNLDRNAPAVDDSAKRDIPEVPTVEVKGVETLELDGVKKIKTTDISY